jgi:hypothetical protein
METLEQQFQQKESAYLSTVDSILKENISSRTKIALIYREHIKYLVAIDNLVSETKLKPQQPSSAAGSN